MVYVHSYLLVLFFSWGMYSIVEEVLTRYNCRHHLVGHFDEIFQCICAWTVATVTVCPLIHGNFDLGYGQ